MNVLLVEDDPSDALYFKDTLKRTADVEVQVVRSLAEAIESCERAFFELAVIDLSLPDSRGLDTIHQFVAGTTHTPAIVIMTGIDDGEIALQAVKAGAQDFIVKGLAEPSTLIRTLRYAMERHRMSQELMAANTRVRHLATHCSLTDLPNRYLFMDRLRSALAAADRTRKGVAVIFIDLDRFKPINDSLGHNAGDLVLQCVAGRLQQSIRSSDTVARLGGDEFTILLRDVTDPMNAQRVMENITNQIAEPIVVADKTITIHLSAGIAVYPRDGASGDELLRNADAAMYHAKRNFETYRFWSDELSSDVRDRLEFERALETAVRDEELALSFHPQVDAQSGAIVGCEALVRWYRPGVGWLQPADFIPVAEECGLIHVLGDWVLRRAVRTRLDWAKKGYDVGRIAVNVSPRQLRARDFVERHLAILDEVGLDAELLELDITEAGLIEDPPGAIAKLQQLRCKGVSIALDDFGTGYSSVGLLADLPLDLLKIDRQFVQGVPGDARRAATTRAIIHLALELGFDVAAEGVEAPGQRDFLLANGCRRMQGFFFAEPIAEAEAGTLMARPVLGAD